MNQKLLQNIITSELEALTHKELKQIARLINKFYGYTLINIKQKENNEWTKQDTYSIKERTKVG
jgi:hypothetical protein